MTARQSARLQLKTVDSSCLERTSQTRRKFSHGWDGGLLVRLTILLANLKQYETIKKEQFNPVYIQQKVFVICSYDHEEEQTYNANISEILENLKHL